MYKHANNIVKMRCKWRKKWFVQNDPDVFAFLLVRILS